MMGRGARDVIAQKRLTAETSPGSPPITSEGADTLEQRVIQKSRAVSPGPPPLWIPTFVIPIKCFHVMAYLTVNNEPTRSLICSPLPM